MAMISTANGPPILAPVLKQLLRTIHPETLVLVGHEAKKGTKVVPGISPLQRVLSVPTFYHPSILLCKEFKDPTFAAPYSHLLVNPPQFVTVAALAAIINTVNDQSAIYLGNPFGSLVPKAAKLCNVYILPIQAGRLSAVVLGDGGCDEFMYLEIVNKAEKLLWTR